MEENGGAGQGDFGRCGDRRAARFSALNPKTSGSGAVAQGERVDERVCRGRNRIPAVGAGYLSQDPLRGQLRVFRTDIRIAAVIGTPSVPLIAVQTAVVRAVSPLLSIKKELEIAAAPAVPMAALSTVSFARGTAR
jgi:hypothetical protein